jgi:hypothetical protein
MRSLRVMMCAAFVLTATSPASAGTDAHPQPAIAAAGIPFGARTREWLGLQRRTSPDRTPRPLPSEAETRAFQRYLESFSHPIPERFELDRIEPDRP